jgi:hypothetical protein
MPKIYLIGYIEAKAIDCVYWEFNYASTGDSTTIFTGPAAVNLGKGDAP